MNTSNNFTWIKFFNAMLKKICSEYDKKSLNDVFDKVFKDKFQNSPGLANKSGVLDPFTFIAFLNSKDSISQGNRQALCDNAKNELNLSLLNTPNDFDGIPIFDAQSQRYFFEKNKETETVDLLWQIAKSIVNNNGEIIDNIGKDIDNEIHKINSKNTLCWEKISKILFICFPKKYFPADKHTRSFAHWQKNISNFEDFKNYQTTLKKAFNENPYEVSYKAWIQANEKSEYNIWAVGYHWSNGNQDERFIKNNIWQYHNPNKKDKKNFNSVKTGDIFVLKSTYTTGQNHKNPAAKIIAIGIVKEKKDNETFYIDWKNKDLPKEFQDCFCPRTTIDKFNPSTSPEIIEFVREYIEENILMQKEQIKSKQNNLNIPLNQILFGPPGTGKTYNTVIKAMEIIDPALIEQYKAKSISYDDVKKEFDKAKDNHQIEFVTFHQSYAYEEFVEGIKPDLGSEDQDRAELKYVLKNGIFKEICKRAENPTIENQVETGIRENPNIWKVSLKGSGENPVRTDCMDNNRIRIGWDEYGETIDEETDFKYGGKDVLSAFMDKMQIGDIVLSCYSAETIDAIGVITSEYAWDSSLLPKGYSRYRKVKWLVKGLNYNILKLNNDKIFAPATVYQLNNISLGDILDIVKSNGQSVNYKEGKPHVLIIDEINRGNISKIFGELITLIEPDKRQGAAHEIKAKLPYSQNEFTVPQNLYIIGTMNTSDRSIAAVDIALRRRFKFIEMMPDKNLVADFGIGFKDIFEKLNTRIKLLLDRDHQIGHSYFINTKYENADVETLKEIWFSEIIPLLNEYFYCDWEKLLRIIPGFLKQVPVPDDLKGECEDSIYEFKTRDEVSDLKAAFEQKENKKDS